MITLITIIALIIICFIFSLCFRLAGGVLKLALKLIFCVPCAILCGVFGAVLCCTLILIPAGILCFKLAGCLLHPFRGCFCL